MEEEKERERTEVYKKVNLLCDKQHQGEEQNSQNEKILYSIHENGLLCRTYKVLQ